MLLALFLLNIIGVVAIGMLAWHADKKKEVKKQKMIDKRGRVNALPLFHYYTSDRYYPRVCFLYCYIHNKVFPEA